MAATGALLFGFGALVQLDPIRLLGLFPLIVLAVLVGRPWLERRLTTGRRSYNLLDRPRGAHRARASAIVIARWCRARVRAERIEAIQEAAEAGAVG